MANIRLQQEVASQTPDLVWVDKGSWIYPSVLRNLHNHTKFLVHYNTDDVYGNSRFWLHRLGIKAYDLYLTTNRFNVREIEQRYGVRSVRVGMGYDHHVHTAGRLQKSPNQYSVVFIGHWEPHTEKYIGTLLRAGVSARVWGAGWQKAADPVLRSVTPLPETDYRATIAAADIALCFLSRWNRNESTGRSFEIPAIGSFLLAERTPEHEYLFGDGSHAALFSSEDELIEKTRYYLANPEKRQAIAQSGHQRVLELGLSWEDHVRREWPMALRLLNSGSDFQESDHFPFWQGFRDGSPADIGEHSCLRQ